MSCQGCQVPRRLPNLGCCLLLPQSKASECCLVSNDFFQQIEILETWSHGARDSFLFISFDAKQVLSHPDTKLIQTIPNPFSKHIQTYPNASMRSKLVQVSRDQRLLEFHGLFARSLRTHKKLTLQIPWKSVASHRILLQPKSMKLRPSLFNAVQCCSSSDKVLTFNVVSKYFKHLNSTRLRNLQPSRKIF